MRARKVLPLSVPRGELLLPLRVRRINVRIIFVFHNPETMKLLRTVVAALGACAFAAAAEEASLGTVIGIDLGTTYSCVGVFKSGRVEIIANDQGNRITPSYVAWDSSGERLIGDAAKNQATVNPETTVFDVKRLIGRSFNDKTVQADIKLFPFKVINKNGKPNIQVRRC
jgi:endoplasmic reticulum chaperone BiP